MNELTSILLLIAPIVFLGILWFAHNNRVLQANEKTELNKARLEYAKITTPLKISAYERLIAMLERFKLHGLLMRNNKSAIGSAQLQLELMNAVRNEFEMNMSMQMYVSAQVWNQVVRGKEQSMESIRQAGHEAGADATAIKFSQELLKLEEGHGNKEIIQAIHLLKNEVNKKVLHA